MICYVDSSALVKYYIEEEGTADVKKAFLSAREIVVSMIGFSEVVSTIYRKYREDDLSLKSKDHLMVQFKKDWTGFYLINVSAQVIRLSGDLIHKYPLRGFDSVHIASAIVASKKLEANISFLSFDQQQCKAAQKESLLVIG